MSEPILSVRQLSTQLQIGNDRLTVVDSLNFDLYKGQTLALVGESGCGKSLTALSLMRILPTPPALPSTGEIIYQNQNLLQLSEKKMRSLRGSKIAMIFQDPMSALNPVYTIANQLMEVAEVHLQMQPDEAKNAAYEALNAVGITRIEERLQSYPHQLSGGMKQRVMIAMALMCQPDILIADEPTTALDVTIQAQILALIRDLQQKNGLSVLLITHDMGVVAEMAHEVIVMYTAQAIEKGPVQLIFDYPAHPYTAGLFESRPSIKNCRERLHPIRGQVPQLNHLPSGCRFHPRCAYKMDKCIHGIVPCFEVTNPLHSTNCWLYDKTPESEIKRSSFDASHTNRTLI